MSDTSEPHLKLSFNFVMRSVMTGVIWFCANACTELWDVSKEPDVLSFIYHHIEKASVE